LDLAVEYAMWAPSSQLTLKIKAPVFVSETLIVHRTSMARPYEEPDLNNAPPLRCIPAGVCDNCGRACLSLDQAGACGVPGIRCYHCFAGDFRHRGEWVFTWCPECGGVDPYGCAKCHSRRVFATRKPDRGCR
jgi:hypothetical protein